MDDWGFLLNFVLMNQLFDANWSRILTYTKYLVTQNSIGKCLTYTNEAITRVFYLLLVCSEQKRLQQQHSVRTNTHTSSWTFKKIVCWTFGMFPWHISTSLSLKMVSVLHPCWLLIDLFPSCMHDETSVLCLLLQVLRLYNVECSNCAFVDFVVHVQLLLSAHKSRSPAVADSNDSSYSLCYVIIPEPSCIHP